MNPRRVKIVSIAVDTVLDVLSLDTPEFITRLRIPAMPTGYKVLGVNANWMRRCFDIQVEHESFAEVPEGEFLPQLYGCQDVEHVCVARVENAVDMPVYREA